MVAGVAEMQTCSGVASKVYGLQLAGKATAKSEHTIKQLIWPIQVSLFVLSRCRILREGRRLQKEEPVALERLVAVDRLLRLSWGWLGSVALVTMCAWCLWGVGRM